jgi:hypothetical protein
VPLPASGSWHPTAKKWYLALRMSAQTVFYQPSDWMEAYVAAEILSELLNAGRVSAMLYAAWAGHTARLLVSEGDRRRMRVELEKAGRDDEDEKAALASVTALSAVPG